MHRAYIDQILTKNLKGVHSDILHFQFITRVKRKILYTLLTEFLLLINALGTVVIVYIFYSIIIIIYLSVVLYDKNNQICKSMQIIASFLTYLQEFTCNILGLVYSNCCD